MLSTVISGVERFAYKGVASNLVTYLTDVVKMSNSSAAKMVNSWCGFTSMVPLLVAPLADSYWDRFSTIKAASLLYALGLILLTSTASGWLLIPMSKVSSSSFLHWSLYLISVGQGGYNTSLQAFGADQLENGDELPSNKIDQSSDKKRLFFQWWYFGVCCGSLLGVSLMSYIQDNLGWGLGFAIPAISFVASIAILSSGKRFYKHNKAKNVNSKSIKNMIQTVKATLATMFSGKINRNLNVNELELQEKPLCDEDPRGMEGLYENSENGNHLLQIAKVVLPLLPVWTMLLMFAVIFQQPATFFTKQGMTMKRNIGREFKIPPAALQSAITVTIILLMPLYDILFIPLTRILTHNDRGISVMQRMGIGMLLSVIAMVIAALTERKRLELSRNMAASDLQLQSETVALSIFWLLPQYILLGISDIFTVVGMQEFFYSEVPLKLRTTGISLYTSVFGVGNFLSALLISLVEYFTSSSIIEHGWFADDTRNSRLDNYYWLLAILSAISFIAFVIFCRLYTSRT